MSDNKKKVSENLFKKRIIFLDGEVDEKRSNKIISELLFLDSLNSDDILFYIKSGGGSVWDGMGIYDMMQHVKSDIITICIGKALSMGGFLLASGAKGKRFALKNSAIMVHQTKWGTGNATITDMKITTEEALRMKKRDAKILSFHTGKKLKDIEKDLERDFWLTPKEAKKYGLIDKII